MLCVLPHRQCAKVGKQDEQLSRYRTLHALQYKLSPITLLEYTKGVRSANTELCCELFALAYSSYFMGTLHFTHFSVILDQRGAAGRNREDRPVKRISREKQGCVQALAKRRSCT
jgi:hypothetical protein